MLCLLTIIVTADPQLTIIVSAPWEDCPASAFVRDAFEETPEGFCERFPSVAGIESYGDELEALREACEPWEIVTWEEIGLPASCEGLPAWTIDDERGAFRMTPIRRDVLLGYHPDVLENLAYVQAICARAYEALAESDERSNDFDDQTYVHGRDKWFRRVHDNCLQADGRAVTFSRWEPIVEPWPPVTVPLGWRRTLHDRVRYDRETNTTDKRSQHVKYEPDWDAVRRAYDMGAGVIEVD